MSQTLAVTRTNVYELLRDTNPAERTIDSESLARLVVSKAQEIGPDVGLAETWVDGAFTLTVGSTADYDLPTNVQYWQVIEMKIQDTGARMSKIGLDMIERLREGITASTGAGGDPQFFALYETTSQKVKVRIDVVPGSARKIDVFRSTLPPSTYTDATVLEFSESFLRVLEKAVALEVLASLTDDERQRLKLNPEIGELWQRDVDSGIKREQYRQHRLKVAPYGVGARI